MAGTRYDRQRGCGVALNQAVWFTGPRQLEIRESPLPEAGPDEVVVKTAVSAISAGTEMLLYLGLWPDDVPVDETIEALSGRFQYPLKYGYACVGQVVAVGAKVAAEWHGRWVFAFQPHQSYFAARPEQLHILPPGMPPETAVLLPNMETAVSFVMDGNPLIGEQVILFGQGIVGLLTTMLLAQYPLAALVTVDAFFRRRAWSAKLGATAVLDPDEADILAKIASALQGERPYSGADLAFELSGNPAALDMAIQVTGFDGRVIVGSWYGQKQAALALGGVFHRRHIRLLSSQVSYINSRWQARFSKNRRLQLAWQMLARHQPEQLISQRYPIDQAPAAYQLLDENAQTAVQILLTYPD